MSKSKNQPFGRRIYDFLQDHYVISTLSYGLVPAWCTFLMISGKSGLLKNAFYSTVINNDELKPFWFYLTIGLLIIHMGVIFLKALADRKNMISNKDGHAILKILLRSMNTTVLKKVERLKEFIDVPVNLEKYSAYKSTTKPEKQIEVLTDNLIRALSDSFDLNSLDISVSFYYGINGSKIENKLWNTNLFEDLPIDQVLSNPKSTLNHLLSQTSSYVILPDKIKAIEEGKYVPCTSDQKYKNEGSIICKLIPIKSEQMNIVVLLTINIFGKKLCEVKDEGTIEKIAGLIFPVFYMRFALELELYFIKNFLKTKCKQCKGVTFESHTPIS